MHTQFENLSDMLRTLLTAGLLMAGATGVSAQTSIQLTSGAGTCSYPVGQVTSTATPGQLAATISGTPTGSGCSAGGNGNPPVSFTPAQPLTLATAMPLASNSSGESANFTFTPANASQCTGTITPSTGTGFSTTFCTSAATCVGQQSVTATFPPNTTSAPLSYLVQVSCTGAGSTSPVYSPANSNPPPSPQVTVNQAGSGGGGGGSCPSIKSTTTGITNFTQLTGIQSVTQAGIGIVGADVTQFKQMYNGGWPGAYGLATEVQLPFINYLSEQFQVPSSVPTNFYGDYTVSETDFKANISMTISTNCGDFSNPATNPSSTVLSGCWINTAGADSFMQWTTGTIYSGCYLSPGGRYYLNIINANIANILPNGGGTANSTKNFKCDASTCPVNIFNGVGNWGGYTPPPSN